MGIGMTNDANRTIAMYRLAEDGTWDTVRVEIPANTHSDKIEEVGRSHVDAQYGPGAYMLYDSMDDDCPDGPMRSRVEAVLSFDLGQTTVGTETEQQAAAIEQINLALRLHPHGLGARLGAKLDIV